jgi:hypothetical protein
MDRNRYELPVDVDRAGRSDVEDLIRSRFSGRASVASSIEFSPPIAVVHLGLDTLLADGGIEAAQQQSWRQLVSLDGDPVGLADIAIDEAGTPRLTQLNYGQFVGSIARVLSEPARSLDSFRGDVHILQIPALYVVALWFDGRKTDFVVPLPPAPESLDAGREYQLGDFLDNVRDLARIANPDGPAIGRRDIEPGSN